MSIWLDGFEPNVINDRWGLGFMPWNADGVPPFKLVLHTTEGSRIESALAAYRGGTGNPHFTVDLTRGIYQQHVPLDRAAYALRNESGGVETNRAWVIQVELVGFAKDTAHKPLEWYMNLAYNVIDPILKARPEIPLAFPPQGFTGVDGYGKNGKVRFDAQRFLAFRGICGHSHVPENTHWDPGQLNHQLVTQLLTASSGGEDDMYFEKYADPETKREWVATVKRDGKVTVREFGSPRGEGTAIRGLGYVIDDFASKGIIAKV